MVACLEKTDGNAEFHEIVDFLTSSLIHYALTQIHVIVDSKAIVVAEASVRSSLLFNDVDGTACLTNKAIFQNLALMGSKSTIWNEFSTNIASAVICLATHQKFNFSKLIFDGMLRNLDNPKKKFLIKGHKFSGRVTPLFPNMLAQQAVAEGEGSEHPSELQLTPSPAHPIIESQIPTSVPLPNVEDEAVHQELGDRMVRAATTASLEAQQDSGNISKIQSMATLNEPAPQGEGFGSGLGYQKTIEDTQAQTWSEGVPIQSTDPPLLTGNTVGSGEDRIDRNLYLIDKKGSCLGGSKDYSRQSDYHIEVESQEDRKEGKGKNSTTYEEEIVQRQDASKQGRNDDKIKELNLTNGDDTEVIVEDNGSGEKGGSTADQVSTARPEVSAAAPSTPPTTTTVFDDEDLTIAQTLVNMRSEKSKEKEVAFRDVEETPRLIRSTTTLQPLPTIDPKDKGKELTQRLYEQELAEVERVQKERQTQEEASMAALYEEYDTIQASIDADALFAAKLQ
ncbi:hypothetical protein Tco_1057308 [Tanacetum coccineum]|uniref:Uncharacterized protein n=1 Tax=Tanacetum coccineum TaxID=301880 RepID=A0ABQ5H585_9ASTR